MGISYGTSIIRDNLEFYYDIANKKSYPGTGTSVTDLSGNNHTGTLISAPTYSSDGKGSLVFNGDNYVSIPNNILPDLGEFNTFSICVWVKPNTDANPRIMSIVTDTDNIEVGYMQTTLYPYIRLDSTTEQSSIGLASGEWQFIAYQYQGILGREIFVNGESLTLGAGGITADAQYSAFGGGYAAYQMNGSIGLALVYSSALNPNQINQIYNATKGRYGL